MTPALPLQHVHTVAAVQALFHNSVKGKSIHPHEKSLRDFALDEKGDALMVDLGVSTD